MQEEKLIRMSVFKQFLEDMIYISVNQRLMTVRQQMSNIHKGLQKFGDQRVQAII